MGRGIPSQAVLKPFIGVPLPCSNPSEETTIKRRSFSIAAGIATMGVPALAQSDLNEAALRHRDGLRTGPHFLGAQIAQAAGIDMLHVPYKGAPDILNDLYGGRVTPFVTALSNAVQPHKDGRMRLRMTTGERRSAQLSDVQTATEVGSPQLTRIEWFGLAAPTRTPADTTAALHAAVQKALVSESLQKSFATLVAGGTCNASTMYWPAYTEDPALSPTMAPYRTSPAEPLPSSTAGAT